MASDDLEHDVQQVASEKAEFKVCKVKLIYLVCKIQQNCTGQYSTVYNTTELEATLHGSGGGWYEL